MGLGGDITDLPGALACAPTLRPDIVQIDIRLPRRGPRDEHHGVAGLLELAAGCGATVMALSVDTLSARDAAQELGASLGRCDIIGQSGPLADL